MKNIHILPTTQKSRLATKDSNGKLEISDKNTFFVNGWGFTPQNIYITSAQEIKVGDWYYLPRTNSVHKCIEDPTELNLEIRLGVAKIIITTDQSLIVNGIQAIDDEFLEWFIKNPSCEEILVTNLYGDFNPIEYFYEIITPKKEQKQHLIDMMNADEELGLYEETAEEYFLSCIKNVFQYNNDAQAIRFMEKYYHAKKEQERSYSEEEVFNLLMELSSRDRNSSSGTPHSIAKWFEQFKKK